MVKSLKEDIEKILPLVSRPSRYLNSEWNAVYKDDAEEKTSICLCFPDIYEIGISNQSIEILYTVVNRSDAYIAERCYCPAADMEQEMRSRDIPLCSLESGRPLAAFDLVGFTLQSELCYTNVLHMLDLAGIPKKISDRQQVFPLIIGGGPCAVNPEAVAEFFDAFVLGDSEDALIEVMDWIKECKKNGVQDKQEILKGLSRISGVYIPSLYDVVYKEDGRIQAINPVSSDVPRTVQKRIVDLEHAVYPEKPMVPFMHAVHDRLNIEIARGCVHDCRFCQASRIHSPVRQRSVEKILEMTEKGLSATGFEEIALSALSTSDYTHIEELVKKLVQKYAHKRIAISLPSLRCNDRSLELAKYTRTVKKSSLTFAPEAATPRMWQIIKKTMDGENILNVLANAYASGWKQIKLYFMYGLPWERTEDIAAIHELVKKAKRRNKQLNFNVTISPFIPKAHTPFQWCPQEDQEVLEQKRSELVKKLPGNVRPHSLETSMLEAVFARGDRRLSACILEAYNRGCRFDQWREHFKYDKWQEAFSVCGIDPKFYTTRERPADEVFPWDHLLCGSSREALYKEYIQAQNIASEWKEEQGTEHSEVHPPVPAAQVEGSKTNYYVPASSSVQRMRLRFGRSGRVRFLSQLEQINTIRRMLRRADLPLAYTQGFHPQPKISFGPAIAVGYSSDAEYVDVELTRRMDIDLFKTLIEKQLPGGFTVLMLKRIPVFFPSLEAALNQVQYRINGSWPAQTRDMIDEFKSKKELWIEKIKKGRKEQINLSPIVKNISLSNGSLDLLMDFGPKKNVKPTLFLSEVFKLSEKEVALFHIHKVALYISKQHKKTFEP